MMMSFLATVVAIRSACFWRKASDIDGAEGFDFLLGGGPHIRAGDDAAEAARGGDGLQPGHAGADDEHTGGRHGAGGGHHHGKAAGEGAGGLDDRAVAGEVGLAGEHVHRLGAGDAREQFHGDAVDAGFREGRDEGWIAEGVHGADEEGAGGEQGADVRAGGLDGEEDFGALERGLRRGGDFRAGGREIFIRYGGREAGFGFDGDGEAEGGEFFD